MRTVIAAVLAGLACVALPSAASAEQLRLAQAGSAGGPIGDDNKSVTGRRFAPASTHEETGRAVAPRSHARAGPKHADTGPKCSDVAGVWDWFNGDVHVFSANGTMRGPGVTGNWTCSSGAFVLSWSNGYVDDLTLSSDGSRFHLSGRNQYGMAVNGTRR